MPDSKRTWRKGERERESGGVVILQCIVGDADEHRIASETDTTHARARMSDIQSREKVLVRGCEKFLPALG